MMSALGCQQSGSLQATPAGSFRTALTLPRLHPAAEGGPPPVLRTAPGDGPVRTLSASLEQLGVAADPAIPEVVVDGRLRSQLSGLLKGTVPNLYLYVGPHDGEGFDFVKPKPGMDYPDSRAAAGCEPLEEPLVAFVSCAQAWAVDAEPFRVEVERACGALAAAGALRLAARAVDPLMLVWDAAVALDYVRNMHWHGWDDDTERLAEFKHELAHMRGCTLEEVSDEDAREDAAEYFWTRDFVRARLPEPYADGGGLGEAELAATSHPRVQAVVKAAGRCRRLTKQLAVAHPLAFGGGHEYHAPWAVVLTIGGDQGLVSETFEEEMRGNYEAGFEEMPVCGLGVDPANPESVGRLLTFLRRLRGATKACLDLLRVIDPSSLQEDASERRTGTEAYRQMRAVPASFLDEQGRLPADLSQAASALRALTGAGDGVLPWPSSALPAL